VFMHRPWIQAFVIAYRVLLVAGLTIFMSKLVPTNVRIFATRAEARNWFELNHGTVAEAWIGYYKKGTAALAQRGCASYDDCVEEALCFGWIDGICKRIDDESYCNRFTPRKIKTSNWSAPNIERYNNLLAQGMVHSAGIAAFEGRKMK
jgi:uncharacterized protein YdeI (YjbR/CyaY-like superfamily)